MEFAVQDGRDDRARHDARGGDAHDDLGIVFPRDPERERARELPEERPLDLEDALHRVDFITTWRHGVSVKDVGKLSRNGEPGSATLLPLLASCNRNTFAAPDSAVRLPRPRRASRRFRSSSADPDCMS